MTRLYSIGDVHEMTGLSVSALRYYADMKVVCPVRIDRQTGYPETQNRRISQEGGIFPGGDHGCDGGCFGGRTTVADVGANGTDAKANEASERTNVYDGVVDEPEPGTGGGARELQDPSEADGFSKSLDDRNGEAM